MSNSVIPDASMVEEQVSELEIVVGRLVEELQSWRTRARKAEAAHRQLQQALSAARVSGSNDSGDVEARLRELAEENDRLRSRVRDGRVRAERIRRRLIVMEDEAES